MGGRRGAALLLLTCSCACGALFGIDALENVDCVGASCADASTEAGTDGSFAPDAPPGEAGADADGSADAGADVDGSIDAAGDASIPLGLRPIAPLAYSITASPHPTLRWSLPTGADGSRVEICADKACSGGPLPSSFDVPGTSTIQAPSASLARGVVFWRVRPKYNGVASPNEVSVAWSLRVAPSSSEVDHAVPAAIDVNGDGLDDLLWPRYGNEPGARFFLGESTGVRSLTGFDVLAPDGAAVDSFCAHCVAAGDVDHDGRDDLLASASADDGGGAYVMRAPLGADGGTSFILLPSPDGSGFADGFQQPLAAGDVNGDGIGDVVVGDTAQGVSAIRLYLGHAGTGPSPVPSQTIAGSDGFGLGVALGDFDGDGYADVLVGSQSGMHAFVYLGGASGLATTAIDLAQPGVATGQFGRSVTMRGDLDGDGYADAVVADPFVSNGAGMAYVFAGGPWTPLTPSLVPITLTGHAVASAQFGWTVETVGDVDGDHIDDLVVGTSNTSSGTAFVYGVQAGDAGLATWKQELSLAGGALGDYVAPEGDLNGDGFADVLVFASNPGTYFVYRGGDGGLAKTAWPTP